MNGKIIAGGLLVLVLIGLGFFFFSGSSSITNYPSSGTDLIAFGDSLVAGNGSTPGNDFVSLLSQKIGQPIINLGIPGNTTADGLARIGELDAYHPKVVLLLLGGNDYLKRVPMDETDKNLELLIQEIQKRGAIVLLLGVRGGVLSDHFAGEFKSLAAKYHTAFVSDVLSGLFGNKDYMSDEVHPNDAGYAIIANRIYPVLAPLLK